MSLLDRIADSLDRFRPERTLEQRAVTHSPGYNLYSSKWQQDKPSWLDRNVGSYRQAFASQVAVYACVIARATAVSTAPVRVYTEAEGDPEELPDHPLRRLMRQPNPEQSEAEWLMLTQVLMDATGFAAVQKARNAQGQVIQLWHLRSDWLKEVKRNGRASDWEYLIPGREPFVLKAEDVLIVAGGPTTDLASTGMSPIAVALREVGIDTAMTDFLKLFIDQGGMPIHALVTPEMINDQAKADVMRGMWQQAFGGFRNWGKTPLLSGGLDVKKIGSNIDELAYPVLRNLTEAHICAAFRVPPIVAGMQAGLEASTYSNYEQARKAFYEETVTSLWARLDGALTRGLLSEFTEDTSVELQFDTSQVPALQEDKEKVWERARSALAAGAMTLNQFQMAVGLPGFGDEGDVLYLPISVMPTRPEDLTVLADQTAEPPQPVPAALPGGDDGEPGGSDASGDAADSDADTATGEGARGSRGVARRSESEAGRADRRTGSAAIPSDRARDVQAVELPLETRANISRANRRAISRLTAKHAPRLRAMFKGQGKLVAAAVAKRSDLSLETRDALEIPWDDLNREMLRELNALYDAAGQLAASGVSTAVGFDIDWDLANPWVRQTLADLGHRIVGVTTTTRTDVADLITTGLNEGLSLKDIADSISHLFTETYQGRAMTIARTESMYSYGLASLTGYRESGVVESVQLYDNPDHDDDPSPIDGLTCAQRNGLVVPLGDAQRHLDSEHPNGTMAVAPVLVRPLGA